MRQSMDFVRNPWIARMEVRQVQIRGQSMDCAALTIACLVRSQVQSEDQLQVSGVALSSLLVYASHSRARIKKIKLNNKK